MGSSTTSLNAVGVKLLFLATFWQTPKLSSALFFSTSCLLIPSIFASSSILWKHWFSSLYSMIFAAFALPMPFSSKNSLEVALFISTAPNNCIRAKNRIIIYLKMILAPFDCRTFVFIISFF